MTDPPSLAQSGSHVWDVLLVQEYPGTQSCDWAGGQYLLSGAELWVGKYDYTAIVAPKKVATLVPQLCVNGLAAQATEVLRSTKRIMDACDPAGYSRAGRNNTWQATRTYGTCYVILCTNPSEPDGYNWDPDQRILRCVAFSRLVLPTAIGFQYAARVRFDKDGTISTVEPSPGHSAYTVNTANKDQERHWLTKEEWVKVSELLSRWPRSLARNLPRISRAIRCFEETAREYSLDNRYELLVRTAEVLWGRPFGKPRKSREARFKRGLTGLATEFGIEISDDHAHRAWHRRSQVTHGIGLPQPSDVRNPDVEAAEYEFDMIGSYMKVEQVLRMTIRRAIEDDDFAARFESETSLEDWLTNAE